MDLTIAAMSLVAGIVAGIGGGAASAIINARATQAIERLRLETETKRWGAAMRREDSVRFVDLKRERFAAFLSATATYVASLELRKSQVDDALDRFDGEDLDRSLPAPLAAPDHLRELSEEIQVLATAETAVPAGWLYDTVEALYREFGQPPKPTGTTFKRARSGEGRYDHQRRSFILAARTELAGERQLW